VLFRAGSLQDALHIYSGLASGWSLNIAEFLAHIDSNFGLVELAIVSLAILSIETLHYINEVNSRLIRRLPEFVRWPAYIAAIWLVIVFLVSGMLFQTNFIYARF